MWIMFFIVSNEGHSAISPQRDSFITGVLFDTEQPTYHTLPGSSMIDMCDRHLCSYYSSNNSPCIQLFVNYPKFRKDNEFVSDNSNDVL